MDAATRLLLMNRKSRMTPQVVRESPYSNPFQEPYSPVSSKQDAGIMVPKTMKEPMRAAMERIRDQVGDLDEFVALELHYPSLREMHECFMGLQVDAIAAGIWQLRAGKALINSDMTGVGKGRVAAAICRWTILNGMLPIFATYNETLFTDFYRDLCDIGFSASVWPLLFNAGSTITDYTNGKKIFGNRGSMKSALERISETNELPRGRNAVFLTYSQINTENQQQIALQRLAPNAVFILDESHNAGGESNTGLFLQDILKDAKGVMFLSATWAKRPDNLPLYACKTDMGIAISGSVADAIQAGGAPLQAVVSNQLAQSAQLMRRELSFEGISIHSFVDESNREQHEAISDQVTEVLRAIMAADVAYHEVDFERKRLVYKRRRIRITHHKFSAIVHNIVKQFLLALKSDAAADCAIQCIGRNEKPIITLESTMGAFLDSHVYAENLSEGDFLDTVSWATILRRALHRTIHISIKQNGKSERIGFGYETLCVATRLLYEDADKLLDALVLSLPISPIDWIRWRIVDAGHSVAEITGRDWRVNYSGPVPVLSSVPKDEQNDRVKTGSLFNNGGLDSLILNQAGSTGISLHASEKFRDQRVRHMIVAQPAGDVNVFMQILGRSNRTGQMQLPRYTMLSVAIPAEIRPAMSLAKKLKSLNANTSSNTRSSMSVEAPDLMNKYGDSIVAEWLHDNPQTAKLMGLSMDANEEDGGTPEEDLARTATGRSALLPVKEQREFMETITESYIDYIGYLDETGQNDLEPRTYDFDAKETRSETIYRGTVPSSPFGQDAHYKEFSIKRQGKAYSPAEVEGLLAETFGENATRPAHERDTLAARELDRYLESLYQPYYAGLMAPHVIDRAIRIREYGRSILKDYRVGVGLQLEINGDSYNGIIYRIEAKKKISGNPYAPSSLKFYIAVNGPLREIRVPGSKLKGITVSNMGRNASVEEVFKDYYGDSRQRARVLTGNLLAAYGLLKPKVRGRIISFTMEDGSTQQGILMSAKFDWEKDLHPQDPKESTSR